MNLYEYQAKKLFDKYNLPIPNGIVCNNLNILHKFMKVIHSPPPWVGKCQIKAGGRGKSGGIKILKSEKELESFVKYWLGKRLVTNQTDEFGEIVHKILLETHVNILSELYFSMLVDRSTSKIICLASKDGGIEIEKIAQNISYTPYKIFLDPSIGPQIYQGRKLGFDLGLNFNQIQQFVKIFMNIGNMFLKHDLILVEINPLVITEDNHLLCLDAKITIDQNALFRQKKISLIENINQENDDIPSVSNISNSKLNYVPMKGNIGCIVNGAGLAMATMDLLSLYGGEAANFLDIGGDVTKQSVIDAITIITNNIRVKVIFINIFGGIVCCNLIAEGIIKALSILHINLPLIVRLEGNNADLGNMKLLKSTYNIITSNNLFDAIQKVILITNK